MEYPKKQWEIITLKVLTYLLPLVFLLPLYTAKGYFFPFIVPRNILFRIIIGVAFALFSMLLVARPKAYIPQKNYIIYALLSLLGILTFSSFINGDFQYAFWSNYERMEGILNLIFVMLFIFTLAGVYRTKKDWLLVLRTTVFISIPVAFIGLSQHVGADLLLTSSGGERVSSTLGNATYLAAYAMFHIFFALYLLFKVRNDNFKVEAFFIALLDAGLLVTEKKFGILGIVFDHALLASFFVLPQLAIMGVRFMHKDKLKEYSIKAYFAVVMLLNFYVLFNTQTRGALLGLFAGLLFILAGMIFLQNKNKVLKQYALGALILLLLAVSSIFFFKDSAFIQNTKSLQRVASISLSDTTARTRLFNWEAAWIGFKEKPIVGWGEERYYQIFNENFPEEIYRHGGSRVWFDRPHNVVIQYFVAGGLLGGIAYLAIFATAVLALYSYWRRTDDMMTLLIFSGVLGAYVIQNLFVFDNINTYIFFALIIGLVISLTGDKESVESSRPIMKKPALLLALLVLMITYTVTIPIASANKEFITSLVSITSNINKGDFDESEINDLEESIEKSYVGRFELRQHYSDTVREFLRNENLTDEQKIKFVESSEKLLLRSIDEQPKNVRHYAFLGSLYVESQRLLPENAEKNIDLTLHALELSPTRTHLYYALGRSYLVAGDAEKALDSFSKAVELSPTVSDAHINYIAALITTKNTSAAMDYLPIMREALDRELSPNEYLQIAAMYASVKDGENVQSIFATALETYPDSLELLEALFGLYMQMGDTEKALEVAERMTAINPDLEGELDLFRRQLDDGGLLIE